MHFKKPLVSNILIISQVSHGNITHFFMNVVGIRGTFLLYRAPFFFFETYVVNYVENDGEVRIWHTDLVLKLYGLIKFTIIREFYAFTTGELRFSKILFLKYVYCQRGHSLNTLARTLKSKISPYLLCKLLWGNLGFQKYCL